MRGDDIEGMMELVFPVDIADAIQPNILSMLGRNVQVVATSWSSEVDNHALIDRPRANVMERQVLTFSRSTICCFCIINTDWFGCVFQAKLAMEWNELESPWQACSGLLNSQYVFYELGQPLQWATSSGVTGVSPSYAEDGRVLYSNATKNQHSVVQHVRLLRLPTGQRYLPLIPHGSAACENAKQLFPGLCELVVDLPEGGQTKVH
jgi:hypothetical protein